MALGDNPVKSNPNPFHNEYLGWVIRQNIASVCYLVNFAYQTVFIYIYSEQQKQAICNRFELTMTLE